MESILRKFQDEAIVLMEKLIQALKCTFSHKFRQGSIWQDNYRDTLIRDSKHFASCVRYIRWNPRHFTPGTFTLWESDRAKKIGSSKE